MKHRRAEAVDVYASIGLATEQFRRRIAHGADSGDAFFFFVHPPRDSEIDQHDAVRVAVEHQVRRFQIAIDDRLRPGVQVMQDVGYLHSPLSDGQLIDATARRSAQPRGQIAARYELHYQVEALRDIFVEVIETSQN